MRLLLLLAAISAVSPAAAEIVITARERAPFAADPVADEALDEMRGGVMLPNGLSVAIGIDIQTRVNGLLVLHTVFASDGPAAGTRVFTQGAGTTAPPPASATVTTGPSLPIISASPSPTGPTISVAPLTASQTINVVDAPQAAWATGAGENEVTPVAGGAAVATPGGSVSLQTTDTGQSVTLDAGDLQVMHLLGRTTGAVVANTASDRIIDTVSSVNIDLMNANPLLAAGLMTNEAMARDIVRGR